MLRNSNDVYRYRGVYNRTLVSRSVVKTNRFLRNTFKARNERYLQLYSVYPTAAAVGTLYLEEMYRLFLHSYTFRSTAISIQINCVNIALWLTTRSILEVNLIN